MSLTAYPNSLKNGIRWLRNPYSFLDEAQSKHGLTFTVNLPGMGRSLVTGDHKIIQEIITNKNMTGGKGINVMRSLFGGESLMMLHGETHRTHRRLLIGPFQQSAIAHFEDPIVQTTLDLLREIPYDQPFSIFDIVRKITQISIIRLVFGSLPKEKEAQTQELIHAFMTSFDSSLILFLKPLRLNLGIHSPWGRITHNQIQLRRFILSQIRSFREAPKNEQSLLAHMCINGDLCDQDMVTEIFAMLMFGHDTTAVATSWTFAHIYSHPAVLARLKDELSSVHNQDVTFLQACVDESMRLSPAVVQLLRVAEQDVNISGHQIKEGEMVMPCLYLAHHDPAVFPNLGQFVPERFMSRDNFSHYSYFPFGLGNRLCVGKHLAQQQIPLMISTIIQNADLTLARNYEPSPVRYMTFISPKNGTSMIRNK